MTLLFSDIHANKTAMQEIEKLAPQFDELLFCGDVCGYGEDYAYCLAMFRDLNVKAVLGNHDWMVIDETVDLSRYVSAVSEPILATRKALSKSDREYLEALPRTLRSGDIFITHSYDLTDYLFTQDDCEKLLSLTDAPIIGYGHTHVPVHYQIDGRQIVNPGAITKGRKGSPRGYAIINGAEITINLLDNFLP